ncbi:MAG: hypothetical protein AB8B71_18455 [Paracoccaceae bacterium]
MKNVIALNVRQHRQPLPQRLAQHATVFSVDRRTEDDVFWLKENAEFLNILECTNQPAADVLQHYEVIYEQIEARLGEFPQYYRFLLSICMDLEDLGMPGHKSVALSHWAAQQGLPEAELSDLQRAEAQRLLSRRDFGLRDARLDERLHRFINRSDTFAIPNKKASYELTHIVFYLSEYGRRDPGLSRAAILSLTYAGLLAYLDQNYDLLAEICIALRYSGEKPSAIWEGAVMAALRATHATAVANASVFDDYHAYLVSSWLAAQSGQPCFPLLLEPGPARFDMASPPARPLRDMSLALSETRSTDWLAVRGKIAARLGEDGLQLLDAAERSTDLFLDFYAGFARATAPAMA